MIDKSNCKSYYHFFGAQDALYPTGYLLAAVAPPVLVKIDLEVCRSDRGKKQSLLFSLSSHFPGTSYCPIDSSSCALLRPVIFSKSNTYSSTAEKLKETAGKRQRAERAALRQEEKPWRQMDLSTEKLERSVKYRHHHAIFKTAKHMTVHRFHASSRTISGLVEYLLPLVSL